MREGEREREGERGGGSKGIEILTYVHTYCHDIGRL